MAKARNIFLASALAACTSASADPTLGGDSEALGGSSSAVPSYPAEAHPFGRSMADWGERWWQWIYHIPAEQNPFVTPDADCQVNQAGPVFFLPTVIDPGGAATVERSCSLPEGKALLVTPGATLNDFPCPFPGFEPPPGVPLYDFLKDGIASIVSSVTTIDITIDGVPVPVPFAHRTQSPHLFEVDGDASLQSVLDPCITGTPQPAYSDGYFVMLKPLSRGSHELAVRAIDTHGTDVTVNWHLSVSRH
jgi:hypothetical protein